MGQVSYEFGPNFKQRFLAKEQATRAFEIIILLIFFEQSSLSDDGHFNVSTLPWKSVLWR